MVHGVPTIFSFLSKNVLEIEDFRNCIALKTMTGIQLNRKPLS